MINIEECSSSEIYQMLKDAEYVPQKDSYYSSFNDDVCLQDLSYQMSCISYNKFNSREDIKKAISYIKENDLRLDDIFALD